MGLYGSSKDVDNDFMNLRLRSLSCFLILGLLISPSLWANGDDLRKAPKLPRKGDWIQVQKKFKPSYKNKVTLVYFWDYTSANSIREISFLRKWDEHYRPYGFQILFVHAPEFAFAKDKQNVSDALKRLKIPFPVYLDNDFKLWGEFDTRSWPSKYIIDDKGRIRYTLVGEGNYVEVESQIRAALLSLSSRSILPDRLMSAEYDRFNIEICGWMTGDTYTGHKRASWWGGKIANKSWLKPDETAMLKDRGERVERGFFAEGLWSNTEDEFVHARETKDLTDYIGLVYIGHEVYVVAHQLKGKKDSRIYVTRDGEPVPSVYRGVDIMEDELGQTYFKLTEPRLYYLITNENLISHELRLWSSEDGDAINVFSFANICLSDFDHL